MKTHRRDGNPGSARVRAFEGAPVASLAPASAAGQALNFALVGVKNRVPCNCGTCTTPVQVTSSQLIASEILPVAFVKVLLYPGAFASALTKGTNIPHYNDLLEIYNLSYAGEVPPAIDLRHLEISAGSYFSVAGAILGLRMPGRLSLFGMLLLLWGLIKEATYMYTGRNVHVSPTMFVAIFIALLCIKRDVKQIVRSFQAHRSAITATMLLDHMRKRRKEREMKRLEWTVNYTNPKAPRSTKVAQVGIKNTF